MLTAYMEMRLVAGAPVLLAVFRKAVRAGFPAAAGVERQRKAWVTKFDMLSPRYTTRRDEVPVVGAAA